jgi:hypothetical protein
MDFSGFDQLGNLAKKMQNAYSEGMKAMNQAGDTTAETMKPDHQIIIEIKLSANVEGHPYEVDAIITFDIELQPVLDAQESPLGDLSSMLGGLGVDLGEDGDAVMKQLGQPRAIGVVRNVNLKKLTLFGPNGKIKTTLNEKGSLLATLKDRNMHINCEGVFSYPDHTEAYAAIPSMEAMQAHMYLTLDQLDEKQPFEWSEPDKDHLQAAGTIQCVPK